MSDSARLVSFEIDGNGYALHLAVVERVIWAVEVTPLPKAPAIVQGLIDMHGHVIPLISLRRRFNLRDREVGTSDHFIVARMEATGIAADDRRLVALAVGSVQGVVEVATKDISGADAVVAGLEYVEGVVRVAGGLLLIHDLNRCLSLEETRDIDAALEAYSADG